MLFRLVTRVRRVGILSLSSLVVGGTVLILFARKVGSSSKDTLDNQSTPDRGQGVFRVGSQLSVQSWLAILGATFGLLSYGLTATYTHIFDCYSSWRAKRHDEYGGAQGLDYARYLNSQAQAPVMLGLYHGFPAFTLLRYAVAALGIGASLGYKFAVLEVTYFGTDTVPIDEVQLRPPPVQAVANGTVSPWVSDAPRLEPNHAFVHTIGYDDDSALVPPRAITMAGWANCNGLFDPRDWGVLITCEVVMVATLEENYTGFSMTNEGGWVRTESGAGGWFHGSSDRAVIDYRIPEPGRVEIRWGKWGSWVDDGQEAPAERRLAYKMRYAVAEMHRQVVSATCLHVYEGSGWKMAVSQVPIKVRSGNGSVPVNDKFLAAMLYTEGSGPRDGVSAILRAIMAGWGAQLAEMAPGEGSIPLLGHAPRNSEPFGTEDITGTYYEIMRVEYPFYYGE